MIKSFITLAMVANLTTVVIYRGTAVIYRDILTLENVANAVNYCCIFITLAPGETVRKTCLNQKLDSICY
jgi:hypothetical protein